uniref:Protein aurora borealis n=1 Tax=Culex tarsalis TaxID=7177 RepID=A0A1Q3EYQ1_CULTA
MDPETFLTPRKMFQNAFNAARKSAAGSSSPSVFTPTRLGSSSSRTGAVNGRFHLLPAVVQTPPSCRVLPAKVVNPFESLERLHLPMIASPSIFHRPATPRASNAGASGDGSAAVFEWTIDEVSSLGQANFEPYESQFLQTPDTAREAKAQAAISAYFNEISVPSPVDCPLRNQKIILNAGSSSFSSSFAGRKSKRKRDGICQTVLTFPPVLPPELEAMLAPYFNFHDNQQQTHEPIDETTDGGSFIDHDARDASLRRKLFNCASDSDEPDEREDSLDQLDLRCLSPPPVSPELDQAAAQILKRSRCFSSSREIVVDPGDISISPVATVTSATQAGDDERESFGALSPISKRSESPSPMKPGSNSTELPGVGTLAGDGGGVEMGTDAIYRSTPERPRPGGIVAMNCSSTTSQHHMSVELNDSQQRAFKPTDRSSAELTEEDDISYEENLLASSQSSCSISTSQQHPTTPVRRHAGRSRTRRNRKNLSHSFLLYSDELDEEQREEEQQQQSSQHQDLLTKELHRRSFSGILTNSSKENLRPLPDQMLAKSVPIGGNFYRMDSGFNEEETTRGSQETADYDETDVSMQSDFCCDEAVGGGTPQRGGRRRAGTGDGQHHTGCSIRL